MRLHWIISSRACYLRPSSTWVNVYAICCRQGLTKLFSSPQVARVMRQPSKCPRSIRRNLRSSVSAPVGTVSRQALGAQYHFGRKGQGPLMPGMLMLPPPNSSRSVFRRPDGSYDWEAELEYGWRLIDMQSCGSLAAYIVECIQSSGGMHVLPPGTSRR